MAKLREPRSFYSAIMRIIGQIGDDEAAASVGKSAAHVRNWTDPDRNTLPSLTQALQLDCAYIDAGAGDPPILTSYVAQIRERFGDKATAELLTTQVLRLSGELGEFSNTIAEASSPTSEGGVEITPNEAMRALSILERVDSNVNRLFRQLRARIKPE